MTTLASLEAKYARAQPPRSKGQNLIPQQITAVKAALAHLKAGNHQEAHETLFASPAAMTHPMIAGIANAMKANPPPPGLQAGGPAPAAVTPTIPTGEMSLLSSLTSAAGNNPNQSDVLKGHAMALLRAHLSAARAMHQVTGDTSGYQQVLQQAQQMNDPAAVYAIMQEMGSSPAAAASAPLAVQAAQGTVPKT